MRLNPHLHVVFLDGAYHEDGTELAWNELGHLRTRRRAPRAPARSSAVRSGTGISTRGSVAGMAPCTHLPHGK
ncbi:hypothetical protein [Sorangium cellulosum]|uniref:hypothetical protein n=1 Tax=Sorangium cellulosum TaxID=56 RepID=UPI003B847866